MLVNKVTKKKIFTFFLFKSSFFFSLKICPCILSFWSPSCIVRSSCFLRFRSSLFIIFFIVHIFTVLAPFLWVNQGSSCSVSGIIFFSFFNSQMQFCYFIGWFLRTTYQNIYIYICSTLYICPFFFLMEVPISLKTMMEDIKTERKGEQECRSTTSKTTSVCLNHF